MEYVERILQPPLHRNVAVCLVMVFYYKIAIELASWMRVKWGHSISRHVLQIFFSSLVIFWPYFDTSEWSWRLNAMVPVVVWTRLFYKGAIVRDSNDPDVQNISLSSSPHDLLFGPAWSAAVMFWMGMYMFMTDEAAVMAAVSLGDALAPLIGTHYGRHIFHMPLGKQKTVEGSVAGVFLGTASGCYFYLHMMGIPALPLRIVLSYAALAAVSEATAPGNLDNIVVPLMLHFSKDHILKLLPP